MDLKELPDEELSDHLNAVLAEQERRASLESIPEQITELRDKYAASGGDPTNLP